MSWIQLINASANWLSCCHTCGLMKGQTMTLSRLDIAYLGPFSKSHTYKIETTCLEYVLEFFLFSFCFCEIITFLQLRCHPAKKKIRHIYTTPKTLLTENQYNNFLMYTLITVNIWIKIIPLNADVINVCVRKFWMDVSMVYTDKKKLY